MLWVQVHALLNGVAGVMAQPAQASQYQSAGYMQHASWTLSLLFIFVLQRF